MGERYKGSLVATERGLHVGWYHIESIDVSSDDYEDPDGLGFALGITAPTTEGTASTVSLEDWGGQTVTWSPTAEGAYEWYGREVLVRKVNSSGTSLADGASLSVAFP